MAPGTWRTAASTLITCVSALTSSAVWGAAATAAAEDSLVQPLVEVASNREPVIVHAAQLAEARQKLAAFAQRTGRRPNVLVFILDDVGWGDFGCYGGGRRGGAPTPNFDRLAREGPAAHVVLLAAELLAVPRHDHDRPPADAPRIAPPPMYRRAGRPAGRGHPARAAVSGRLRHPRRGQVALGENVQSQPQNSGFDEFYGFYGVATCTPSGATTYFYPEIVDEPVAPTREEHAVQQAPGARRSRGGRRPRKRARDRPSTRSRTWTSTGPPTRSTSSKRARAPSQPWFLYHATPGCHFDNYPPDSFKGKSPASTRSTTSGGARRHRSAGSSRRCEETGQLENTLVFVTSDNGPEMETWPDCSYTPFRGSKGTTWEGGVRVPGIATGPA